jgi:putative SOS response-associated peptidase YedK
MQPLFAFAGLWRRWRRPIKKDGPVLLTEEQEFETWLSGSPKEAFSLVKSFDADRMHIVQEGFDKEDLLAA